LDKDRVLASLLEANRPALGEDAMTVSAISAAPAAAPQAAPARAADGDHLQPSARTAQTKDNDGDYKPTAAASSPAASSSGGAQAALILLKAGG
jgi:hypothetical protein